MGSKTIVGLLIILTGMLVVVASHEYPAGASCTFRVSSPTVFHWIDTNALSVGVPYKTPFAVAPPPNVHENVEFTFVKSVGVVNEYNGLKSALGNTKYFIMEVTVTISSSSSSLVSVMSLLVLLVPSCSLP